MEKGVFIYGIREINTENIKYVGKTINITQRLKTHLYEAKTNKYPRSKFHNWIRSVLIKGSSIEIIILHKVIAGESWQYLEKHYISKYSESNNLKNTASGGEGGYLYKAKGKDHSQYGRGLRGFVPWNRGIKHSQETIEKIKNHPNVVRRGELNGNYGKGEKISGIRNVNATPIKITESVTNNIVHLFETRTKAAKHLEVSERQIDNRLKIKTHNGFTYEKISKADAIHLYNLTKQDLNI